MAMITKSPLHLAVNQGNVELVKALLDQNVDVNRVTFYGDTALINAAYTKNVAIIKLLLKKGADVNLKNNEGQTVMHFATSEIIPLLLNYGSNIHASDYELCTPLHYACEYADKKTIKLLLKNGADLNARDSIGRTPVLHVLGYPDHQNPDDVHQNPLKIMPFLLDFSDVNVIDKNGNNIFRVSEKMECWLFIVLEHFAKLKVLNIFIQPRILDYITSRKSLNKYFTMCVKELLNAKNTKFHNSWVSLFHLLVDDQSKLVKYAGNRNIVKEFEKSDLFKRFPVYGIKMHANFLKAISIRKIWENSTITLSDCLPIFDHNHLIIKNILDCLAKKKLLKLID